jgi:hypothetical protein
MHGTYNVTLCDSVVMYFVHVKMTSLFSVI